MFCRIGFVILSGWLLFGAGYASDNEPLCLIQQGEKCTSIEGCNEEW